MKGVYWKMYKSVVLWLPDCHSCYPHFLDIANVDIFGWVVIFDSSGNSFVKSSWFACIDAFVESAGVPSGVSAPLLANIVCGVDIRVISCFNGVDFLIRLDTSIELVDALAEMRVRRLAGILVEVLVGMQIGLRYSLVESDLDRSMEGQQAQ